MKRKSELCRNSASVLKIDQTSSQNANKKSKNIPSQIWLKRNVIKKLTLQLKFNKNSTQQYRKFRQHVNGDQTSQHIQENSVKINDPYINQSLILTPSNHSGMQKISKAKADNLTKYVDNFFAANAFAMNGLKSYHYKSSALKEKIFINVSKAVIQQKKNQYKRADNPTYHQKSLSQRQRKTDTQREKKGNKRQLFVSTYREKKPDNCQGSSDFLKVSTKQIHSNNQEALFQASKKDSKIIFSRRSKTQASSIQKFLIPKQKINRIKSRPLTAVRPQSCIVKAKKTWEISNCEGWVTVTGSCLREQEEPFSTNFKF